MNKSKTFIIILLIFSIFFICIAQVNANEFENSDLGHDLDNYYNISFVDEGVLSRSFSLNV